MNVGRKVAGAVGVAAFVPLTVVGLGAQQAQAADAAATGVTGCVPAYANTTAPQPGSRVRFPAPAELRVAPGPECAAITVVSPADLLIYFCSTTAPTGRWTYLRDHDRGVNGWVYSGALRDYGSQVECPVITRS
ncbi:hypothetical protein [Cryptosporangium phraense]|uniref:SH3 domain-containing protein n=1 Tax=Cryptosporangium phraense TaxID=2593070 RepID=A0A545AM24_9ACTN|nr:hypothetical protein [Cryptosporangium phraense]TQS42377.1 hypothetical protein FL583_23985 [Cryptosporangium phraense]